MNNIDQFLMQEVALGPLRLSLAFLMISLFALAIAFYFSQIKTLQRKFKEERKKRLSPVINLDVETAKFSAYLYNDSHCPARNIRIADVILRVDIGFQKTLLLKFEPLDVLKPNQKRVLTYKVFDGSYDVTSKESHNLVVHFNNPNFQMSISFENMEGEKMRSVITREGSEFITSAVNPVPSRSSRS